MHVAVMAMPEVEVGEFQSMSSVGMMIRKYLHMVHSIYFYYQQQLGCVLIINIDIEYQRLRMKSIFH